MALSLPCRPAPPSHTMVYLGGWFPVLIADDWQAHMALLVHIGVVDLSLEYDLGGLQRILAWKSDLNPKGTSIIWRLILDTKNRDGQEPQK